MYGRKTADYEGRLNLLAIWNWIKGKGRAKLKKSLQASREAYRKALRKHRTEAEMYDEVAAMDD